MGNRSAVVTVCDSGMSSHTGSVLEKERSVVVGERPPGRQAQESGGSAAHRRVLQRLGQHLWMHRRYLIPGLLCGALAGFAQAGIASMIKDFVNGLSGSNTHALAMTCILVVLFYALKGFLSYGQSVLLANVAQRVGLSLRRDVYAHLQSLSLSYFHRRQTGALMSTLTNDVPKLQSAAMTLKDVVATPIQAITFLVSMWILSKEMTCFTVIVVPFIAIAIQRLTRRIRGLSRQSQERSADLASVMEETLAAPRIVRAFTAETHEIQRFERESERVVDAQLRSARRSALLGPVVDVIGAAGVAMVLYYGGSQVLAGKLDSGGLIAFLFLMSTIANATNEITSMVNS